MSGSESEGEEGPLAPLSLRLRERLAGSVPAPARRQTPAGSDARAPPSPGVTAAGRPARGWDISDSGSEVERAVEPPRAREKRQRQPTAKENTRRALAQSVRALTPGHCLSHMLVSIDPGLLEEDRGGETLTALEATQSGCVIEEQAVGRSVTWRRRRVQLVAGGERTSEDWVEEPHVLVHVPLEGFLSMVYTYSQEVRGVDAEGQVTLQSFSQGVLDRSAGRTPALVVLGLEQYFRTQRKPLVTEQPGEQPKPRNQKGRVRVSRVDVEVALVHIQLTTGIQVQFLENWKEFADHINRFTKAIAETPFKRAREKAGISFHMENSEPREVKVDRSGQGLLRVWSRQIQQLNRVSADMANAIVSAYPSPWLLNQAYKACSSERERQKLLAAIPVRRGEGVTSTTRRIGPQLSKHVYLQMTSTDPGLLLQLSGSSRVEACRGFDGGL